jgi:adenine specific DNA methylase Mod
MSSKFSSTGQQLHHKLQLIKQQHGWWFVGKRNIILQMIQKYKPRKNITILDIGCKNILGCLSNQR